jgi:4-hydroxy-3-polyprenylbenzoate decarboxylase
MMRIVVGITGASGTIYAQKLVEKLSKKADLEIVVSETGREVIRHENTRFLTDINKFGEVYENDNFHAPIASGSHLFDAMIIVPCSMKTLGLIANGIADNLMARTAEVCLKEKRKLILCPRETPLSPIHLENMAKLSKLGVIIAPLMPSFYTKAKTIDSLVDHVVNRLLDLLGVPDKSAKRWGK